MADWQGRRWAIFGTFLKPAKQVVLTSCTQGCGGMYIVAGNFFFLQLEFSGFLVLFYC